VQSNLEILTAAQELIRNPAHWAKGDFAFDDNGGAVDPTSSEAICFCALGAIGHVLGHVPDDHDTFDLLGRALNDHRVGAVPEFNDQPVTTHAEVMAMFDKARELARATAA
jgi:hypothetical protein